MNLEEINRQFDILSVAENQLGLRLKKIGANQYRGVSVAPGTHSTDDALAINTALQSWYDFSANEGGSVLGLVALAKFGSTDINAICEAAKFLAPDNYNSAYWEKRQQQRDRFHYNVSQWHEALIKDERTLEYLHSRRITDETINERWIGLANEYLHINGELVQEWRLTLPYFDTNSSKGPVYMASRRLDWAAHEGSPKYHKIKQNEFFRNSIYGLDTLPQKDSECDVLIVLEGMFDGLSFMQEQFSTLCSVGGAFGKENDELMLKHARRFRRIITAFDIDKNGSGQKFTISYGKKFLDAGLNFSCIPSYGRENKDVSDYYAADGNLHELIDTAINGYVFMSRYSFWETQPKLLSEYCPFDNLSANEKATALSEVKKFIHKLKKFMSEGDISQILDALKEYYPSDRVDKFAEGMTHDELMQMMRDEFLEGKHIFFHGSIKHGLYYEYQPTGCWERMTDAGLQSELSEHFRHSINNKTLFELTTMIRVMHTRKTLPKFNSKRLWPFQNGVLDLDTGAMRNPTPDDFLSWQVAYNYNEDAKCPAFDKFMQEITLDEPSRLNFLDDMLGYLPFSDNRLAKIFVLIGDGANGKGTFLNVIENLVRNVNADSNGFQSFTSIPFCEFSKPTQLIMLDGSIVNLSYDLNENLRGCESTLKSVSSGDTVSGNKKFCDTVSFTPRCKLICASNHMLKLNDDSYGMRRRLMFCRFENCFKGRENTNLSKQLIAELPGIFNRMYRAYKALLEREKTLGSNAIRPCADNDELMTEFTQTTNPIAAFWTEVKDEYLNCGEVKKSKIFDDYRAFCERNSRFAGTENVFHKNLKQVANDDGITIDDTRHREGNTKPYYSRFSSTTPPTKAITLEDVLNADSLEIV